MKKALLLLFVATFSVLAIAQEGQKLNIGLDASFGVKYVFDNKEGVNNPTALGFSLGYEYSVNMFFGVEAGFRLGGFNQKVGYFDPNLGVDGINTNKNNASDIYKGTYWAPFVAPKLYFPIGYDEKKDRARYVFLENRFSYARANLDLDKVTNLSGGAHKYMFLYEIKLGYQFPVNERWAMSCWLGYNTFDFSKIKPEIIKLSNATPIQIGIGFNYIIKHNY